VETRKGNKMTKKGNGKGELNPDRKEKTNNDDVEHVIHDVDVGREVYPGWMYCGLGGAKAQAVWDKQKGRCAECRKPLSDRAHIVLREENKILELDSFICPACAEKP
jgi:hypothetical protein